MTDNFGLSSGAYVSPCGRYRTKLWRDLVWHRDPVVFVMLNPSTADAMADDPTIRRCRSFAERMEHGGFVVVNLSPWRATDPRLLDRAHEMGMDVLRSIENLDVMASLRHLRAVFAWGAGVRPWMAETVADVQRIWPHATCLGTTKGGQPRHPLMLPRNAAESVWA